MPFTGPARFPGGVGKTQEPGAFEELLGDITSQLFGVYGDDTTLVRSGRTWTSGASAAGSSGAAWPWLTGGGCQIACRQPPHESHGRQIASDHWLPVPGGRVRTWELPAFEERLGDVSGQPFGILLGPQRHIR